MSPGRKGSADTDSAGVYYMSVEDFEARSPPKPDENGKGGTEPASDRRGRTGRRRRRASRKRVDKPQPDEKPGPQR